MDRKLSDHSPIMLADKAVNFGPIPFRFFDLWLEERDIEIVVGEAWNKPVTSSNPDRRLQDRLKDIKTALRKWSVERFGVLDQEIEAKRKKNDEWERAIEHRSIDAHDLDEWRKAREEWINLDRKKTRMLKQKTKVKWAIEGDENTRFFHSTI